MSQQGLRQASFRAIGSTATDYGGDALAAFAAEATTPAGATFNGAFILWLQERLGSASTNINDLMAEFAAAEGADNAGSVGSFDPSTTPLEVLLSFSPLRLWLFDEGAGTTVADSSGNSGTATFDGTLPPAGWRTGGVDFQGTSSSNGADILNFGAITTPVLGIDIVFFNDVDFTHSLVPQWLLCFGTSANAASGLTAGACTGLIANEVITAQQSSNAGYTGNHRKAWNGAGAGGSIASGWHLLQADTRAATVYLNLRLDGTEIQDVTVATPQSWITTEAGCFGGRSDQHDAATAGYNGAIGMCILYVASRTDEQQAACRAAIATIMAARSVTLP